MSYIDEIRKLPNSIPPSKVAQMLGCSTDYVRAARYRIRAGVRYGPKWKRAGFSSENDWRRHLINKRKK